MGEPDSQKCERELIEFEGKLSCTGAVQVGFPAGSEEGRAEERRGEERGDGKQNSYNSLIVIYNSIRMWGIQIIN